MHSVGDANTARAGVRFSAPDDEPAQSAQPPRDNASVSSGANFASARLSSLRYLTVVFLLAAVYFGTARISLLLAIPPGYATAIWPPAGIAVAALMLLGVRYWPGIWLGATLANLLIPGTPLLVAALIGVGNLAEAVIAVLLANRIAAGPRLLRDPRNFARFAAIALAAGAVAATAGVGTLFGGGRVPPDALATNWLTWWLGDVTGILMIVPLLLSWTGGAASAPAQASRGEYLAFIAALAGAVSLIHSTWYWPMAPRTPLFVMFPVFVWAAMRLDQRAITSAAVLLALFSVISMIQNLPELAIAERNSALLFIQLYVSTMVFAGLTLSAIAYELSTSNAMLKEIADDLEERVRVRTRELTETSVELRALTARVIKLQDKERRQVAAELHDIVGQTLGALAAEIGLLRHRWRDSDDEEVLSGLDRANELAKQAMRSMRQVKTELHPLGIEVAGWPAILRWYGEAAQTRTGASVTVLSDARLPRPAAEVADALVRIYLEVLSNAAKHAKARNIEVTLERREDQMVLAIADDGCGFEVSLTTLRGPQSGWGIAIMRERAGAVGGVLQLRSKPGDGTRVEILVPLSRWS